jgi:hypothetical protein
LLVDLILIPIIFVLVFLLDNFDQFLDLLIHEVQVIFVTFLVLILKSQFLEEYCLRVVFQIWEQ